MTGKIQKVHINPNLVSLIEPFTVEGYFCVYVSDKVLLTDVEGRDKILNKKQII